MRFPTSLSLHEFPSGHCFSFTLPIWAGLHIVKECWLLSPMRRVWSKGGRLPQLFKVQFPSERPTPTVPEAFLFIISKMNTTLDPWSIWFTVLILTVHHRILGRWCTCFQRVEVQGKPFTSPQTVNPWYLIPTQGHWPLSVLPVLGVKNAPGKPKIVFFFWVRVRHYHTELFINIFTTKYIARCLII